MNGSWPLMLEVKKIRRNLDGLWEDIKSRSQNVSQWLSQQSHEQADVLYRRAKDTSDQLTRLNRKVMDRVLQRHEIVEDTPKQQDPKPKTTQSKRSTAKSSSSTKSTKKSVVGQSPKSKSSAKPKQKKATAKRAKSTSTAKSRSTTRKKAIKTEAKS